MASDPSSGSGGDTSGANVAASSSSGTGSEDVLPVTFWAPGVATQSSGAPVSTSSEASWSGGVTAAPADMVMASTQDGAPGVDAVTASKSAVEKSVLVSQQPAPMTLAVAPIQPVDAAALEVRWDDLRKLGVTTFDVSGNAANPTPYDQFASPVLGADFENVKWLRSLAAANGSASAPASPRKRKLPLYGGKVGVTPGRAAGAPVDPATTAMYETPTPGLRHPYGPPGPPRPPGPGGMSGGSTLQDPGGPTTIGPGPHSSRCEIEQLQARFVKYGEFERFTTVSIPDDPTRGVAPPVGLPGPQTPDVHLDSAVVPRVYYPTTPCEIAQAIRDAESANPRRTIRAVGSGWSFSDAAMPHEFDTDPLSLTNPDLAAGFFDTFQEKRYGYIVNSASFSRSLQHTMKDLFNPAVQGDFVHVEAGIILSELNTFLAHQNPPLALPTAGGSAGQTLAGLIATGSHGGDFDRPPIADSVCAIYLIGQGGVHYWIEPEREGVTASMDTVQYTQSPEAIMAVFPCIRRENILYDTDLFDAVLVSMGSMGIVYSMILRVVPQYSLVQVNKWFGSWREILDGQEENYIDGEGRLKGNQTLRRAMDGSLTQILDRTYEPLGHTDTDVVVSGGVGSMGLSGRVRRASEVRNRVGDFAAPNQYSQGNRYLAVYINPMPATGPNGWFPVAPSSIAHTCIVVNRAEVPASAVPSGSSGFDLAKTLGRLSSAVSSNMADLASWANSIYDSAHAADAFGRGVLEGVRSFVHSNEMRGRADLIRDIVEAGLESYAEQVPFPNVNRVDLGYKVMDGGGLFGAVGDSGGSIEAAFDVPHAIAFVNALLAHLDALATGRLEGDTGPQVGDLYGYRANVYPVGYIALRVCGGTRALLGIEQWKLTATVEIALLADDNLLLEKFFTDLEEMVIRHKGNLHWGQACEKAHLLKFQTGDSQRTIPTLEQWVRARQTLCQGGVPRTFNNRFTHTRGLSFSSR